MKNSLTKLLGIKYPILQGGMAWISDAVLVAAVSNAGGAGNIGTGGRSAEWTRDEIRKTKTLTNKPFGVNLLLQSSNVDELLEVICAEKVSFVTLGAGNPVPYINRLKTAGIKVIPVVPNVRLAKRVAENGADAFVMEGMEAGGHIGTLTTMALLSNVPSSVKNVPIIAAGGIADGRALAAALLMGASGAQIGSLFLLTEECSVHPSYKQRIIEASDTDSVVTGYSRGHGVRCLKNTFTQKYLQLETSGAPQEQLDKLASGTGRKSALDGDVENGSLEVSQSLHLLNEVKSCRQVIDTLVAETNTALNRASELVL